MSDFLPRSVKLMSSFQAILVKQSDQPIIVDNIYIFVVLLDLKNLAPPYLTVKVDFVLLQVGESQMAT